MTKLKFVYALTGKPRGQRELPTRKIVSLGPEEVGRKFGEWTIASQKIQRASNRIMLHVKCLCGKEKFVYSHNLKTGRSRMCRGCSAKEMHLLLGHNLKEEEEAV